MALPCHRRPLSGSMPDAQACCCGCYNCRCQSGCSEVTPSHPSEKRSLCSSSSRRWKPANGRKRFCKQQAPTVTPCTAGKNTNTMEMIQIMLETRACLLIQKKIFFLRSNKGLILNHFWSQEWQLWSLSILLLIGRWMRPVVFLDVIFKSFKGHRCSLQLFESLLQTLWGFCLHLCLYHLLG